MRERKFCMKPLEKPRAVGCRSQKGGYCEVTGDSCLFIIPSELSCYNKFYEGPAAFDEDLYNYISEMGEDRFKGLTVDEAINVFYDNNDTYERGDESDDIVIKEFFEKYVEGLVV